MTTTHDSEQSEAELDRPARDMRTVTTSLDQVRQDAALAASLNPYQTEIVDATVTERGELKLFLEGQEL